MYHLFLCVLCAGAQVCTAARDPYTAVGTAVAADKGVESSMLPVLGLGALKSCKHGTIPTRVRWLVDAAQARDPWRQHKRQAQQPPWL